MRSLYISLTSEFYKSKKTLAFWAAILLPIIICGLVASGFYFKANEILKHPMPAQGLWFQLAGAPLGIMGMLILPFYVMFMAFSVNNIEHKNDTWKTLFSQPLNKIAIYAAKYLYAVLLIAICLFLFATLTYASGLVLEMLVSKYKFSDFSPIAMLKGFYLRLFLASLGILSLQFIMSLVWSDFLKPMGIGFVGTIIGIITSNVDWKHAYLIPYADAAIAINPKNVKNPMLGDFPIFTQEIWASLVYSIVFFIVGYLIVSKKSIK